MSFPSPSGRGRIAASPSANRAGFDLSKRWQGFPLPRNLALSVRNKASSPRPSPPEEEREKTRRRFGGSKREFFRGILTTDP